MIMTDGSQVSAGNGKIAQTRTGDELRISVTISSATFEAATPSALENCESCAH